MPDVFTTTTSNASALIANALDLKVRYYLLQTPQFRQHVDVRPINQDHDGRTVTVTVHGELAAATTPLSEAVDVDARDIPATRTVSVTMDEYGATNLSTIRAATFDWSNELARTISFQLADNIATTMDQLVRTVFDSATNVWFNDNGVGYVATTMPADGVLDNLDATGISSAVAALRSRRAIPRDGTYYVSIMHPHVAHDVRRQAGANTWASPHEYQNAGPIWAGETGAYAGARIIEHNRATVAVNQGSGNKTHYTTYFLGREAMLEANAIEPHAVIGPQTDKLRRFYPVGWHGILGWSRFRENSLQLIKTQSSLGTLVPLGSYDPKA
jgi:N4-gp56 family major capsid protein